MSIRHLQDLKVDDFLDVISSLENCTITEKIDGAAFTVGVDGAGSLYTSRKGGKRVYSNSYSETSSAELPFRNAHNALQQLHTKYHIRTGDSYECEVLFGEQPNAIVYGSNRIVFLAPGPSDLHPESLSLGRLDISGNNTQDLITDLKTSNDGRTTSLSSRYEPWSIVKVPIVDAKIFSMELNADDVSNLKDWLNSNNPQTNKTMHETLNINLTSIPKAKREKIKAQREGCREAFEKYKQTITRPLIKRLKSLQPLFRDVDVDPAVDVGIEGVVGTTESGIVFKIVNKADFTAINCFNHIIRNNIRKSSHARLPDSQQYVGMLQPFIKSRNVIRCVYGELLSNMTKIHQIPNLHEPMAVTRTLKTYLGKDTEDTLHNLVSIAREVTDEEAFGLRRDAVVACSGALEQLKKLLNTYMTDGAGYALYLESGQYIGYSPAVHQRTLVMFAEMREELLRTQRNLRFADNLQDILRIVFQKQLNSIH